VQNLELQLKVKVELELKLELKADLNLNPKCKPQLFFTRNRLLLQHCLYPTACCGAWDC
jgi:hypothetical protein